jgi:hypothetical protein
MSEILNKEIRQQLVSKIDLVLPSIETELTGGRRYGK